MARPKKQLSDDCILCKGCGLKKLPECFYRENRSKIGYQTKCKDCLKKYYQQNREKYRKLKNGNKKYAQKTREYQLNNSANINRYKRHRYSTTKGRLMVLTLNHKRREQKDVTSNNSVNYRSIKDLLRKQNYKCALSGEYLTEYHIDHIHPLSRGGRHTIDNIQLVKPRINMSKGNKVDYTYE